MRTRAGGEPDDRRWGPGHLELMVPGRSEVRDYRSTSAMRTIQVHIPSATVERTAAHLGAPDFEALSAALSAGDPVVEQLVRALPRPSGRATSTRNPPPPSSPRTCSRENGTDGMNRRWVPSLRRSARASP
ncbi:hypothetical protein [Amycolatopsis albispora]|uniref:hypothetical protein n=1 Tax=Amycolatopsis albispora TaxID=1804986 RepID=UPI0026D771D1